MLRPVMGTCRRKLWSNLAPMPSGLFTLSPGNMTLMTTSLNSAREQFETHREQICLRSTDKLFRTRAFRSWLPKSSLKGSGYNNQWSYRQICPILIWLAVERRNFYSSVLWIGWSILEQEYCGFVMFFRRCMNFIHVVMSRYVCF